MSALAFNPRAYPLHVAGVGETLQLDRLSGGPELVAHLSSLGFVPGTELRIINMTAQGPIIIVLKGGRMMISQGMARNIWVK